MDGARAEEARVRELVSKLGEPTVSAWTVAELVVWGDRAVGPPKEFVGAIGTVPAERWRLAATILQAIGPAARDAARRSLPGGDTEMRSCDGAA